MDGLLDLPPFGVAVGVIVPPGPERRPRAATGVDAIRSAAGDTLHGRLRFSAPRQILPAEVQAVRALVDVEEGGGCGLLALQTIGVIVRDIDIDGLAVVVESDDEAVSCVIQADIVSQQLPAVLALRIGLEGGQEEAVSNSLLIHGSPVCSPPRPAL